MSTRVLSITVEYACDHCHRDQQVTKPTPQEARTHVRNLGWTIQRAHGYERVECPACSRRRARLVRDGILTKDGYVVDEARYEAVLDAERAAPLRPDVRKRPADRDGRRGATRKLRVGLQQLGADGPVGWPEEPVGPDGGR